MKKKRFSITIEKEDECTSKIFFNFINICLEGNNGKFLEKRFEETYKW